MPNVLDITPVRALAKRAARKLKDAKIAARFERLAVEDIITNPSNFRAATNTDIQFAPDWARSAFARGDEISVYVPNRSLSARIHAVARRLADTCKVAATNAATRPAQLPRIAAAREFLAKIDRVNFQVAARKAQAFSRLLSSWEDDRDAEPVCGEQTIPATKGRVWLRVTSVARLRMVGREFSNCLARTMRASAYGGMLAQSVAQFWVLREADGTGLVVAMASLTKPYQFMEVKGMRNAPVNRAHVDLARLAHAIGVPPASPPPPPPPPPLDGGAAGAARVVRQPCGCMACNPRLAYLARSSLRRRAAAP